MTLELVDVLVLEIQEEGQRGCHEKDDERSGNGLHNPVLDEEAPKEQRQRA